MCVFMSVNKRTCILFNACRQQCTSTCLKQLLVCKIYIRPQTESQSNWQVCVLMSRTAIMTSVAPGSGSECSPLRWVTRSGGGKASSPLHRRLRRNVIQAGRRAAAHVHQGEASGSEAIGVPGVSAGPQRLGIYRGFCRKSESNWYIAVALTNRV